MSQNVPNDSAFPVDAPPDTEAEFVGPDRDWQIKLAKVNSAVSNFNSQARALNAKLEQSGLAARFPNRLSISIHDTVDGMEAMVKANVTVILTARA